LENEDQIDAVFLILVATMGMLVIVFFIIIFVIIHQKKMLSQTNIMMENESKHQKELLDSSLEIIEKEREKIANNIHDDIGMMLNVLKFNLNKAQKNIENKHILNEIFVNSYSILDNSIESIRSIANELLPPTLNNLGFAKAIKEVCRQIHQSGAAEVSITSDSFEIKIDKKRELQLYRLVKEIIHNTLKHSKAKVIEVNMYVKPLFLLIIIKHNGIGISTKSIKALAGSSSGLGLKSILTRSDLIKAKVEYYSPEDKDPFVTIELPL
jgi:signal transduction histidine kinase